MDEPRILTGTQERFLRALFDSPVPPQSVYVSGGTALAAFYLHHRYSDDLDLFTRSVEGIRSLEPRVLRAAATAGLEVETASRADDRTRFTLTGDSEPDRKLSQIDLAIDPEPYFAPPRVLDKIVVDDVLAIAVNKMAIVTRYDLKDYVDLYVIVNATPYRFEDLIPLAKQKLLGLDEWALIEKFGRARELTALIEFQQRYMVKPIDWDAMLRFYADEAERLLALFPPRRT